MTIDKGSKRDRSPSPRSVHSRYFHLHDHSKSSRIPSILRRRNQLRFTKTDHLEGPNLEDNQIYDEIRTEPESQSSCSPSKKFLKIVMPNDLDCDSSVPSSFSPPSNKLPMKKVNNEYREVSFNSNDKRPRNNVRFHSKVLVMRIPSRNQYPASIKRNLWCSLSEIAKSAQRNTIEFSSEGWDWRSAIEEEYMYIHPKTGQYVHPVHVQRAASTVSTIPDGDKPKASTSIEHDSETSDDRDAEMIASHAQPSHE